jgi:hypothetical protein
MEVVRDMFGSELFVGDTVVYADKRIGIDDVGLDMYVIAEISDGVVKGIIQSGAYIDYVFYLEDTINRAARIRNPYKTAECFGDTLLS